MKKLLLILFAASLLAACSDNEAEPQGLTEEEIASVQRSIEGKWVCKRADFGRGTFYFKFTPDMKYTEGDSITETSEIIYSRGDLPYTIQKSSLEGFYKIVAERSDPSEGPAYISPEIRYVKREGQYLIVSYFEEISEMYTLKCERTTREF